MFNGSLRTSSPARDLLLGRKVVIASFNTRMKTLPSPPESLPSLIHSLANGPIAITEDWEGLSAIGYIRASLYDAPGREAEGRALWNEAVATSAFAWLLACGQDNIAASAALGGLLHRAGEAISLRLLAQAETDVGLQFDAPSKAELTTRSSYELARRLVDEWKLPPAVATSVLGWQRFGGFHSVSPEACAVYFGHLLAAELLHPQFMAPGAIDSAGEEAGLDPSALSRARAESARVRDLVAALN